MRGSVYNILTKLVTLYIFALLGSTTVSGQVPVANFTASPLAGCSPLIVNFQDQSTGSPTSWNWDFGNGNTSTLQNPTASYFTPGTYTVVLTATNVNGSNTLTRTQYITVYEAPTVDFSASTQSGCFPLSVFFTDLSTPGAGNTDVAWLWDFGNGSTSTLQNPATTYTTSGFFTVTLRVTNDKGCSRVLTRPTYITVTPGVTADFTNTQATVCAAPATINFTNNSTGPGTLSYQWDFGDGSPFSTALNPSHIYTSNGSFTVVLTTVSTAGCEDTDTVIIDIGGNTTSFTAPASICVNEPVTFTNTSSPAPASTLWNFGDGGTANTLNASYTYTTPGTYQVWMYNTYANCIDSASQLITINPRPVSNFSAPVTFNCQPPLTVNFTDMSTGNPVSWEWDFGDGSPVSNVQNPSHTYTSYGSFNVTLITTTAAGCTDTLTIPSYVIVRRSVISIPQLPSRGCVPHTINFNPVIVAGDVITSYEWDFGDGSPFSNSPTPSHTYTVQGTYIVRLVITTSTGCNDTLIVPQAVRVGTKPVADFSATPIPVCGKQPVFFSDLSVPADEWYWDFGDNGTSILQNPVHNYADTGYFDVTLIAVNNGCADTIVKPNYIYVNPPVARFNVTPDCANRRRFTFTDASIINPALLPVSWTWDFGDGSPVSNAQNPVHIFPALGVYNVRLIVQNGTCLDTAYAVVNAINEIPDFVADRTVSCHIGQISFTVTGINPANIAAYNWDFGNGTFVTNSPVLQNAYPAAGWYTVTLVTIDRNGCRDTVTKVNYIRINGPVANFAPVNPTGCSGLTTTFTDLSVPDGVNPITTWHWDFGDGNSQTYSAPPFQHTYSTVGVFSVKLVLTDASGCRDSITLNNIITTSDPTPAFNSLDTLTCPGANVRFNNTSAPATNSTFVWDFGDGNSSTTPSPIHSYGATGLYTVKLVMTDSIGCADSLVRTQYIRVDLPDASFTVSDTASSCLPFEVRFVNTSTYYNSLLWVFGDGGISQTANPTHYYGQPGIYTVKLYADSWGGCRDSAEYTIYVYDTVGTRVTYTPIDGCKPLSVSLNSFTTGPMATYFWDFGDGNTLSTTSPNVNHIYHSFGNFLPKVIMEDPSGCLIPVQGFETVLVTGANTKFGYSDSIFCDFGTVNFTDSTTFNDPILSYTWLFGDGNTSNLQNPVHTYSSPGLYTVQLAVQTQLGCRDTLEKQALIKVVQRPLIDIAGDSVVCVNGRIDHAGIFIQPDTSVVTWQWNFPGGSTSTAQNPPTQTYGTAGTFLITTYAQNSTGCRDTTVQTIYVNPLPTVTMPSQLTITSGTPVTIPATYSPNVTNWIWSPSGGLSCANCPTPDAGPKFNTTYQVFFTDNNGCSNLGTIVVSVICKDANLFMPNTFSPNRDGSNDIFYPRGKGIERVKTLRIFNRWGEVVFERNNFQPNDAAAGWDGTYKGQKPQSDVYVYQVEVFCENGDTIKLNGNVSLIL